MCQTFSQSDRNQTLMGFLITEHNEIMKHMITENTVKVLVFNSVHCSPENFMTSKNICASFFTPTHHMYKIL